MSHQRSTALFNKLKMLLYNSFVLGGWNKTSRKSSNKSHKLRRTRIETHFKWEITFSSPTRIIPFKMTCLENSSYRCSYFAHNLQRSSTQPNGPVVSRKCCIADDAKVKQKQLFFIYIENLCFLLKKLTEIYLAYIPLYISLYIPYHIPYIDWI